MTNKSRLIESGLTKIVRKMLREAVTPSQLNKILSKIDLGTETKLPFSQGYAIKDVIKRYGIKAVEWGYGGNYIAVATNSQIMVWLDKGSELKFVGIKNKDGSTAT